MTIHTVRLQGRAEVVERTLAFHFSSPQAFSFKAGRTFRDRH